MKVSVKHLKSMISEALEDGFIQLPEDELRKLISVMDPDEVATKEYVGEDTGEIYLSPGQKARTTDLHPQRAIDLEEKRKARLAAAKAEEDAWAREDDDHAAHCRQQFDAALEEFLSNWENDPTLEQGVEHDAAETFFDAYPEAEDWADAMGMSRESMLSSVMDHLASLSG